jgi:hypothetical protein
MLRAGGIILRSRFGLSDKEVAEWIELTAALAVENIGDLATLLNRTSEVVTHDR